MRGQGFRWGPGQTLEGREVRAYGSKKTNRTFKEPIRAPEASISNCLLVHIMNLKQGTVAGGAATTSDPPGRFHVLTRTAKESRVHLIGVIKKSRRSPKL